MTNGKPSRNNDPLGCIAHASASALVLFAAAVLTAQRVVRGGPKVKTGGYGKAGAGS